ncbi:MAG: CGNR zinc finger domain-containing protein [Solirubrobacteraceae bacterium]
MSTTGHPSELPHGLDLVVEFVNTRDIESGTDALATPSATLAWFAEMGLLDGSTAQLGDAEHDRALRLREALRAVALEHNGGPHDPSVGNELERAARDGELSVRFEADGGVRLQARRGGFAGALAAVLLPVARAAADGSWLRIKACRADGCAWAFYDRSRNRSGKWCEMAVCGNRTKVRAYRRRVPERL